MKFLIIVFMLRGRSSLAILVSLVLVSGLFLINVTVDDAFAGKDDKRISVSGVDVNSNKVKLVSCSVNTYDSSQFLISGGIGLSGNGGGNAAGFIPKAAFSVDGSCTDGTTSGNINPFTPVKAQGMTKIIVVI